MIVLKIPAYPSIIERRIEGFLKGKLPKGVSFPLAVDLSIDSISFNYLQREAGTIERPLKQDNLVVFRYEPYPTGYIELRIELHTQDEEITNLVNSLVEYIKSEFPQVDIKGNQKPEKERRRGGRHTLACNVWVDYLVNVKGKPISDDIFQMWKTLYQFEVGRDPDDELDMADPRDSFNKAISRGANYQTK